MILLMLRWRMATRLIKWSYLASSPTGRDGRMSCQGEQSCFRINHHFSWTKKVNENCQKLKALRRWNHLMLATNASINIFIYVAKVEISYSGQCVQKNKIFFYFDFPHIHYHINIKILTLRIQSSGMPLLQYVSSTSSKEDPHNKGIVLSFIFTTWNM